ncbi:hypothetical protein E2C01_020552 [Portunus trituberculatus]|uniref:Uncharacterized protein n=1 Tax=Portunus trituberculatus TaxID=210409 RepID=A0A5B7E2D0_PORTR|nr:hypothetical protein [Portunus trituberculatus]
MLSPSILRSDGTTAISSVSKAELFSQTFAHNSTLDAPPWITDSFTSLQSSAKESIITAMLC